MRQVRFGNRINPCGIDDARRRQSRIGLEKGICRKKTGDSSLVRRSGEVAIGFCRRQHRYLAARLKAALPLTFIGTKEKKLALDERSAEGTTELIALENASWIAV